MVKISTLFSDQWEVPGQLWGVPGSIKDYFKLDIGPFVEVVLMFFCRSGIDLGAILDHPGYFGTIFMVENTTHQKTNCVIVSQQNLHYTCLTIIPIYIYIYISPSIPLWARLPT